MQKKTKKFSPHILLRWASIGILLVVGFSSFEFVRFINSPDSMRVIVWHVTSFSGNSSKLSDVTIHDTAKVQAIYQTMTALNTEPPHVTYSCPVYDDYYTYWFQFVRGNSPTMHATLAATGSPCDGLFLYYPLGFVTWKIVTGSFFIMLQHEGDVPQPPQFPVNEIP